MPTQPADAAQLERERARIDDIFSDGWLPKRPGQQPELAGPRLPFIEGVGDDFEVVVVGQGARQWVAVLFSHKGFPGVRFGHRFNLGDEHGPIWLKEEIETGALRRMMRGRPAPDDAGTVWTTWGHASTTDP